MATAAAGAGAPGKAADGLSPLAVSVFPNAKALPVWIGAERGMFARRGLALTIDETEGSATQRDKLASGAIQIAQSAVDNALAMILAGHDIVIVMGGDGGMNDFVARPDIGDFADFRGGTLLVDAPNTAYALQARELLARAGLALDRDYAIKPVGNAASRLRGLMESSDYAGAVLNPPYSAMALLAGFKSLGRLVDLLGPYQAGGAFLLRRFAASRPDIVEAYIAGYVEAQEYVVDPANKAEIVGTLARRLNIPRAAAEATHGQIVDPAFGFAPKAKLDRTGLRNMLETRARTEGRDARLENLDAYVDEGFYARALAR